MFIFVVLILLVMNIVVNEILLPDSRHLDNTAYPGTALFKVVEIQNLDNGALIATDSKDDPRTKVVIFVLTQVLTKAS